MSVSKRVIEYLTQARAVERRFGISVFRQFAEITRLRRGQGRIGPGDYYAYRLFDPEIAEAEKLRFVGWQAEAMLDALNDPRWHCLGLDKVLMYALFRDCGIRVPQTRAIYLPGGKRILAGALCLESEAELQAWLRDFANYPFFSKPSASGFGRGAMLAIGYESGDDAIVLNDSSRIPVISFGQGCHDVEHLGYLFQVPLKHDRRLTAALGHIPSSLRIMVLIDEEEGPLIHRTFWKIPTGRNYSDNFNSGMSGNLAAAIDAESGGVIRVINGVGLDLCEIEEHPDSGFRLRDLAVPDWEEIKQFVLTASQMLPKLRFQQWDIALTDQGPVALEVNLFSTGGGDLTQMLYKKGLLDKTMLRFLRRLSRRPTSRRES